MGKGNKPERKKLAMSYLACENAVRRKIIVYFFSDLCCCFKNFSYLCTRYNPNAPTVGSPLSGCSRSGYLENSDLCGWQPAVALSREGTL